MPPETPLSIWQTESVKTFSSFSGADIVASLGDRVFGNIQAITYAVQREVAPVHVLGTARPVAYARGKRAVSGSLVFVTFDRDALLEHMRNELARGAKRMKAEQSANLRTPPLEAILNTLSPEKWKASGLVHELGEFQSGTDTELPGRLPLLSSSKEEALRKKLAERLVYADQVPPFNITISFLDELGNTAHMRIEGVQLINEGAGMSIDDVVLEKACTFVARNARALKQGLWDQETANTGSQQAPNPTEGS